MKSKISFLKTNRFSNFSNKNSFHFHNHSLKAFLMSFQCKSSLECDVHASISLFGNSRNKEIRRFFHGKSFQTAFKYHFQFWSEIKKSTTWIGTHPMSKATHVISLFRDTIKSRFVMFFVWQMSLDCNKKYCSNAIFEITWKSNLGR